MEVIKITDSSATLTWNKVKNVEGFYIKLYTWNEETEELDLERTVKVFEEDLTSWKLKQLSSNTEYYVKIKALFVGQNKKYKWSKKELFQILKSAADEEEEEDEDNVDDDEDVDEEDEETPIDDEEETADYNTDGFYNHPDNCLLA